MLRFLFLGLALLSARAQSQSPDVPASASKPNIVLFLADDVGWNSVGYHGNLVATPNVDRLVEEGVELDSFYVEPLCTPTRAALLTGRYPIRYGLQYGVLRPWNPNGLDVNERLLSEALRDAGYETAICGKWHLGLDKRAYLPLQRGFDHQYGCFTGSVDYYRHDRMGNIDWHRDDKPIHERGHATSLIGKECIRILKQRDPTKPLFLYVPFTAAHGPLQPPREFPLPKGDKDFGAYAALITHMDKVIGDVLAAVEAEGMRDNTLVLFVSDNGGQKEVGSQANLPLRGRKGTFYEGGVRVPAVASWPGHLPAGSKVEGLIHIVDLFPTLVGLAGGEVEGGPALDGIDQWKTLLGTQPSPRTEMLLGTNHVSGALREGKWKLVLQHRREGEDFVELFDLSEDPGETSNLAKDHPEVVEHLRARIALYASEAVPEVSRPEEDHQPKNFIPPTDWSPERKKGRGQRSRKKARRKNPGSAHGGHPKEDASPPR